MIGVFSSIKDPGFARKMLGDRYINMTENFIEEGDPMKVYKQMDQVDMFSFIALNNLIVAFRVFIMGIFFAIGTVGSLISEGIRIGAFQYFFIERELFQESFLTIWMHGAPEISSIILAGAAGITLGGGLVFPGTYSRGQALLQGARRGVMIMLGVIPILIFAALIEGFVTRLTDVPDFIRAFIIFLNFGLIIYYFAIYPYRKFHKNKDYRPFEDKIPDSNTNKFELNHIRSSSEIYTEVFKLFGERFITFFKWAMIIVVPYLICLLFFIDTPLPELLEDKNNFYWDSWVEAFIPFVNITHLFNYIETPMLYALNSLFFAIVGTIVYYHVRKRLSTEKNNHSLMEFMLRNLHRVAFFSYLYQLIFFVDKTLGFISLIFILPTILLISFISIYENRNVFYAIRKGVRYAASGFGTMLGYAIMLVFINAIVLQFINVGMTDYLLDTLLKAFEMTDETYALVMSACTIGVTFVTIGTFIATMFFAAGIYYASVDEKINAKSLLDNIGEIGNNKRAYGLPTEN